MNRSSLAGLALCMLTACGGSILPSSAVQAITGRPLALRDDAFPPANGATYTFVDSSWGVSRGPGGRPQPQPTATSTVVQTVARPATFAGKQGLIEYKGATTTSIAVISTNTYYALQGSPRAFELLGQTSSSHNASGATAFTYSSTLTYSAPAIQLLLPVQAGRSWNAAGAYGMTSTSKRAEGTVNHVTTLDEAWRADGAYSIVSKDRASDGSSKQTVTFSVNSDGSASESVASTGQKPSKITIGVPKKGANGKYTIPFTQNGTTTSIPDWYPGGGLPPKPLDVAKGKDEGSVAIPTSCHVSSSIATSAEKIVISETDFDPTGSLTSDSDVEYYAPNVGLVCYLYTYNQAYYNVFPPRAKLSSTSTTYESATLTSTNPAGIPRPRAIGVREMLGAASRHFMALRAARANRDERSRTLTVLQPIP